MPHFDEIYLALSRTSNRYDDEYECIKGNDQTVNPSLNNNLTLTFSFDYYLFKESGILYIDGIEVPKDKYTISKGSTIITIDSSYLNTLPEGSHTTMAKLNDKEAESIFTISKNNDTNHEVSSINNNQNNPKTGDNIVLYISLLGLSLIGFVSTRLYIRNITRII